MVKPTSVSWEQRATSNILKAERQECHAVSLRERQESNRERQGQAPNRSGGAGVRRVRTKAANRVEGKTAEKGNISPETRAVLSQGVQDGVRDVGTTRHAQRLQAVAAPADCDQSLVCDLLLAPPQQKRGSRVSAATFTRPTPFGDFLRSNCRAANVPLVVTGAPAQRWRLLSASTAPPSSSLESQPPVC